MSEQDFQRIEDLLSPRDTCPHCGHKWRYTGKNLYTICPKCKRSVKIDRNVQIEREKEIARADIEWQDAIRSEYERMYQRDY